MVKYGCVVSAQGDDYSEAEAVADRATFKEGDVFWPGLYRGCKEWVDALYEHLLQWDMGEATSDEVFDDGVTLDEIKGWQGDCAIKGRGADYVVTWDTRFGIVSLYRKYRVEANAA